MKKNIYVSMLEKEIEWCRANYNEVRKEYCDAFINGLKHSIWMIEHLDKVGRGKNGRLESKKEVSRTKSGRNKI